MSYVPTVARLESVTSIPGADRIVSAIAQGYRVVVGADHKDGELGVVFPAEGVLDVAFALHAGLLREHPHTGETLTGYLDPVPRIRCLTLRGVRTEALWIPIHVFVAAITAVLGTSYAEPEFAEGSEVGTFGDWTVARKYLPPPPQEPRQRTQRDASPENRRHRAQQAALKAALPEHYDTPPIHRAAHEIPVGAKIYATEKAHGTSGAVGLVSMPELLPAWKRGVNRVAALFGRRPFDDHVLVSRTRRTVQLLRSAATASAATDMRTSVAWWLAPRLRPGEAVYFELVGYTSGEAPKAIQAQRPKDTRSAESNTLRKAWGERIEYAYGCEPNGRQVVPGEALPQAGPRHRVLVYRIVQDGRDLSFEDTRRRALEIGLEIPPLLDMWTHLASSEDAGVAVDAAESTEELRVRLARAATRETTRKARALAEGPNGCLPSTMDASHPREGVVLRVDLQHVGRGHLSMKCKAHGFAVLEGYGKDRGELDAEELEELAVTASAD